MQEIILMVTLIGYMDIIKVVLDTHGMELVRRQLLHIQLHQIQIGLYFVEGIWYDQFQMEILSMELQQEWQRVGLEVVHWALISGLLKEANGSSPSCTSGTITFLMLILRWPHPHCILLFQLIRQAAFVGRVRYFHGL